MRCLRSVCSLALTDSTPEGKRVPWLGARPVACSNLCRGLEISA